MKKVWFAFALMLFLYRSQGQPYETFHDFTQLTIIHDSLPLSNYAGKKVLVVNTASYCGYTYELGDLRILDSLYSGPDFAIICFPCNDFGGQEPYDDSTILSFYQGNYHVGFQLMSKISITAPDTAEVYKWLQLQSRNGVANANVSWNFNKFCIDEAGHWVRHYSETISPLDTAITNWILSPNTTGVRPQNNSGEILIHGNPAYGNIEVEIKPSVPGDYSAELFDLQGKLLQKIFSGTITEEKIITCHPQNLKTGIYFLKISGTATNRMFKVAYMH